MEVLKVKAWCDNCTGKFKEVKAEKDDCPFCGFAVYWSKSYPRQEHCCDINKPEDVMEFPLHIELEE